MRALPHLDDSAVQEGVITSKKKRDDTVQKLNEFDYSQTVSLNPVEQDIQTMDTWLTDMQGMFHSGLTDVHFQPSRWGILSSRNTLKMELEARQTLSVSFHNQYNWNTDKLLSILEYKRPILFGFSGFINRESPFISPDLIVISNIKKETSLNKSFESGGVFVANVSNKVTAGTHENVLFPLMQTFDSDKNPTEVWRDLFAGNLNDGESTYNLPKHNSKVAQTIADTLGYTIGDIGLTKALRGAGLGMKTGLPFLSKGRILSATKEGAMVGTVMASTEIAGRETGRPKDYNWKENTIQFGMEVVGGAVLDPLIDTALPLIKSTSSNPAKKLLNNQPVISHSSSYKIETAGEVDKGTGNSIQYAETGGRNISPEQFFKEEAIAEEMYEKFRNLGTEDVNAIAKNTGFSVARIQRIKDHVFNNSHIKDYGVGRFDPDYELAQAWQRLIDGKQVDSDIQLLHHEIFESKFEGIFQTNYRTAHDKTIESGRPWNWEKNYGE
ncbi:T7SS effector LXG polymorphic toxin [Psychrobacillus sp. FSL K6-4046]|uniref:T7SS effector LXG polymorphic toxin n=1 Tax=Psychrobacillus sp. FSL K6-4046 TaxID=2921550 RepID=UPI00315A60E3